MNHDMFSNAYKKTHGTPSGKDMETVLNNINNTLASPDTLIAQKYGLQPTNIDTAKKEETKNTKQSNDSNTDSNLPKLSNDELHTNLQLLGSLKAGDRLRVDGNLLAIDNYYGQSVVRMLYGITRTKTVEFLSHVMHSTFTAIDELRNSNIVEENKKYDQLTRYLGELKRAVTGLDNLKATYETDNTIKARINVISEDICERVQNLTIALKK